MGREVRRVPADWDHPKKYGRDSLEPLYDGYGEALEEFRANIEKTGLGKALDYHGGGPVSESYMPGWPEAERTHFQMYEDTTEGTPISPPMPDPESLARWLVENNASAFGGRTASYDHWLVMARSGWAPSMVMTDGKIISGVEAIGALDN